MSDYQKVYRDHPERYEQLVRAEDHEGNLAPALANLVELSGAKVAEAGAGTGRVTRLLLEAGASHVYATEREPAMIEVAERTLANYSERLTFAVADAATLPIEDGWADLGIAGWVFGHFRHWMPDDWEATIGKAIDELSRVTRAGGTLVVIETLGTGEKEPQPPNAALAEYYEWMERVRGFRRKSIRTDYNFDSVDKAARVMGFFFGEAFAERVTSEKWTTVPECTGIWWKRT